LPTERALDEIDGFRMSCVDVRDPCIFVQASQLGVRGTILPGEAEAHPDLVSRLESLRRSAAIASVPEAAPKILVVSPPAPYSTLSGDNVRGRFYRCDRTVTARFDAKGSVSEAAVFRAARRIMEGQVFWKEV
jgi:2-methylaconitate cis-trans-isomerase PrpF